MCTNAMQYYFPAQPVPSNRQERCMLHCVSRVWTFGKILRVTQSHSNIASRRWGGRDVSSVHLCGGKFTVDIFEDYSCTRMQRTAETETGLGSNGSSNG